MTNKRIAFMKELLEFFGLEPERLRLEWVSASEGQKFARVINEFADQIGELGESPLNNKVL
jgi:F420-non-reducing hydrogenase iron-sulfur subunit